MGRTTEIELRYARILSMWRSKKIDTRDALASELNEYRVYFAYHSGRIENERITFHDTREVFEDGRVVGYTGDVRTLFELQNLKECHERIMDAYGNAEPITEPFVREIQGILTKGTYDERRWRAGERPGTYKVGDYVVGVRETGSPACRVEEDVSALVKELAAANAENVLTVAAYFHLSFESIHPFADGNGRTGRALMNYLFVQNDHPPVIVYDEDKMAYYGAIDVWDADADLEPMKLFLQAETVKTWGGLLSS